MTAEVLAKMQFEAEEDERKRIGGSGNCKWIIWKWEQVTEEGRAFKIAVARRVLEKTKGQI